MKKNLLALSALALLTLSAAHAQETAPNNRAAVRAEAAAAEKAGTLVKGEGPQASPAMKSTKPRAEVRREAASAERAGTLIKGEGPAAAASRPSQANRAVVRAQAASANQSGQIGKGPDVKK